MSVVQLTVPTDGSRHIVSVSQAGLAQPMPTYDASHAAVLRRADTAGIPEDFDLPGNRYGVGISWHQTPGCAVDVDLQCVVVDSNGVIVDCAYYNNLKAAKGITHSGDEAGRKPDNIQEVVWVTLPKLPDNISVLIFVVAAYSGGTLATVNNGKLHILEQSKKSEIAQFDMERSNASVDVVAAMHKSAVDKSWRLRIIEEPAQQGQHFMDVLPLLSETIRLFLPTAPRRQKVAFAMEKGGVLDLPQAMNSVTVGLGWDVDDGEVDLDVSAVLLDAGGEFIEAVFFGQLESDDHGIRHSGDNLTGEGAGDDEQIVCPLNEIGSAVQQVFFCINIYTPQRTFQHVARPYCRVVDNESGTELCRYELRDAGHECGLLIARLSREAGNRWGFHALGLPCRGRTYKDSLSEIRRSSQVKTASLMLRTQTTHEFHDPLLLTPRDTTPSAPPYYAAHPPVPATMPAKCGPGGCLVQ